MIVPPFSEMKLLNLVTLKTHGGKFPGAEPARCGSSGSFEPPKPK